MAPVTELAKIPLKADARIEATDSAVGRTWQSTLETISQQRGYQRLRYGRQLENSNVIDLLVDWDSVHSHHAFQTSKSYSSFLEQLETLTHGPIDLRHVEFEPWPPTKAVGKSSAPVTEVLTAYVETQDANYATQTKSFLSILEAEAQACTGVSSGWQLEQVAKNLFEEDRKGHAHVSVIGWESKEKHLEFRETSTFKDNIHLLRDGSKGLEVNHTTFEEI